MTLFLTLINRHDIQHHVKRKRLLFLPRLLDQGAPALIMILDATLNTPGSFASMLCEDLSWMTEHTSKVEGLEHPNLNLAPWLSFFTL